MKVYKVGGCIRDKILKLEVVDEDYVVIGSTPQQMLELGFKQVGRDFPVFLHPKTHAEYALARSEKKVANGHKGFICDFNPHITLEQDLKRRDITINAIAQDVVTNKLIDPFYGVQDLHNKIIRHVSDAFTEDPLRVLRVARFAAKLNFTVAPSTITMMEQIVQSKELLSLSSERIWLEINKIINLSTANIAFTLLNDIGSIKQILPEMTNFINNKDLYIQYTNIIHNLVSNSDFATFHFALLCYFVKLSSNETAAHNFIKNAILNKEATSLALLLISVCDKVKNLPQLTLEEIDHLIHKIDPMRRSQRFNQLLKLLQLIANHFADNVLIASINLLIKICDDFAKINYSDLIGNDNINTLFKINQHKQQIIRQALKAYIEPLKD
jgi:tRNA nucleotidyltransferase (CCA-adding enzyme)